MMACEIGKYWHTLRFLRPVQLYGRLWFRFYKPRPETQPAPRRRNVVADAVEPCHRLQSLVGPERFSFLNHEAAVGRVSDWNAPGEEKLWLYNLHYFDDLNAQGGQTRSDWHLALLSRWIADNPPGQGVGWEPYPTSLRIVNWVKWALCGHGLSADMECSLAVQVRWLRRRLEYHLLGNHLLANAKALVVAGLFFEGEEARRWYQKGMALLARELPEQVLNDGGHFERSPMYHLVVLEDLLDLINMHRSYDMGYPKQWDGLVSRMLDWSRLMRHPDGEIPFFNDAAFGIAPQPVEIDAYAERIGAAPAWDKNNSLHYLAHSGYARLVVGDGLLLVDMAPIGPEYLPAHAHADTLSFELSLGVRRVVVNGGTSVYGLGEERHRQRSTVAHATVVVDGENSTEVWGGFRVARRAEIVESRVWHENEDCVAMAMHDGYRRLAGKPLHRRTWRLRPGELRISDQIRGGGAHRAEIIFPLAPGLHPVVSELCRVDVLDEDSQELVLSLQASSAAKVFVEPSTWNPEFGRSIKTWRIRLLLRGPLPFSHETVLRWDH